MIDYKQFVQIIGILQMKESSEDQSEAIFNMYDQYLNFDKEQRDAWEKKTLMSIKPVVFALKKEIDSHD